MKLYFNILERGVSENRFLSKSSSISIYYHFKSLIRSILVCVTYFDSVPFKQ